MTQPRPGGVPPRLFNPRSIAIVGASADPLKLSHRPLEYLRHGGYAGEIFVVNARADEVAGLRSYARMADLPAVPDVAFLVVPGAQALQAATECAKLGVGSAVVASTGFAEAGEEGAARQLALTALTREWGIRFVGPNTNGLYATHQRLSLGYNAAHAQVLAEGPVSIVSHSGALFSTLSARMNTGGVGLSKFVAVGNEADLDMLDFFEYLVNDPQTQVILLVLEALRDGTRFLDIAARAQAAGKPVAVLKLGMTQAGAASTNAHSSRLAGSARAYRALLDAAGVAQVSSVEALVAFARLVQSQPPGWQPRGLGLGVLTASGGGGTLIADAAVAQGLEVAALSDAATQALTRIKGSPGLLNPLDVTSVGGTPSSGATAALLAGDGPVDAVVAFLHTLPSAVGRETFARAIGDARRGSGKPHLVIAPGTLPAEQAALLASQDVPVFTDSASAMEALAAFMKAARSRRSRGPADPEVNLSALPAGAAGQARALNEIAAMRLFTEVGIRCVARAIVADAPAAKAFAAQCGTPIVLKGVVDGIEHKSDVGLVQLHLDTPDKVAQAFERIGRAMAGLPVPGHVCAQQMMRGELELIVGVVHEAPLGRFLLMGLGGRYAEAIDDVQLLRMPASRDEMRAFVLKGTVGRVVTAARWPRASTLEDLVEVLERLQTLTANLGPTLQAMEINPLLIGDAAPVALDALIVLTTEGDHP
jgi:acyl-CoA synthetase (NDP forming)